jgi:mannobiose 2-epimerase
MPKHPVKPVTTEQEILHVIETCEKLLNENIIPFWYSNVLDHQTGGYRLNHDAKGRWKGHANKSLVVQARTLWFFSRLSRTEHEAAAFLDAAHLGYRFIRDYMWDKEYGGFYWEVSETGHEATMPGKHLYAQAFGLYALAEYIRLTGDSSAVTLADELFKLLEFMAHDSTHGGYKESFRRDWSQYPDDQINYLGKAGCHKTLNTHLHLLEATTEYYRVQKSILAHERLNELIILFSRTILKQNANACVDEFQRDWEPVHGTGFNNVSYGHQLELIWMLIHARDAAGVTNNTHLTLYRTLFDYVLQYGYDSIDGGFYHTGTINRPADDRKKVWWVQAESLICSLHMYDLTQEILYFECFFQTLDWIVKYQADWIYGDWHEIISEAYKPFGKKAYAWKSPYHNGRAILLCMELLSRISKQH